MKTFVTFMLALIMGGMLMMDDFKGVYQIGDITRGKTYAIDDCEKHGLQHAWEEYAHTGCLVMNCPVAGFRVCKNCGKAQTKYIRPAEIEWK